MDKMGNIKLQESTVMKIRELRFIMDNAKEKISLMLDAIVNQTYPNNNTRWNLSQDSTELIPEQEVTADVLPPVEEDVKVISEK